MKTVKGVVKEVPRPSFHMFCKYVFLENSEERKMVHYPLAFIHVSLHGEDVSRRGRGRT